MTYKQTLLYIVIILLASCEKKYTHLTDNDKTLAKTLDATKHRKELQHISIDDIRNDNVKYAHQKEYGKMCIGEALAGYYYNMGETDKAMAALKNAESKLKYCDTIKSFVHLYLGKILYESGTDNTKAMGYINMALSEAKELNDTSWLPDYYLAKSLTYTNINTALIYLDSALSISKGRSSIIKAKFAEHFHIEMAPDDIIKDVMHEYNETEVISLIQAYITKDMTDSAEIYLQKIKEKQKYKFSYIWYNAAIAEIRKDYSTATKLYKEACEYIKKNEENNRNIKIAELQNQYEYNDIAQQIYYNTTIKTVGWLLCMTLLSGILIILKTRLNKTKRKSDKVSNFINKKNKDIRRLTLQISELRKTISILKENISAKDAQLLVKQNELDKLRSTEINAVKLLISDLGEKITDQIEKQNLQHNTTKAQLLKKYTTYPYKTRVEEGAVVCLKEISIKYPDLNKKEILLMWLIFIGYKKQSIDKILNLNNPKSQYNMRSKIASKLGINKGTNSDFNNNIVQFLCQELEVDYNPNDYTSQETTNK